MQRIKSILKVTKIMILKIYVISKLLSLDSFLRFLFLKLFALTHIHTHTHTNYIFQE